MYGMWRKTSFPTPKQPKKHIATQKSNRILSPSCGALQNATPTQREKQVALLRKMLAKKQDSTIFIPQCRYIILRLG
jgi:hypothetical protein